MAAICVAPIEDVACATVVLECSRNHRAHHESVETDTADVREN